MQSKQTINTTTGGLLMLPSRSKQTSSPFQTKGLLMITVPVFFSRLCFVNSRCCVTSHEYGLCRAFDRPVLILDGVKAPLVSSWAKHCVSSILPASEQTSWALYQLVPTFAARRLSAQLQEVHFNLSTLHFGTDEGHGIHLTASSPWWSNSGDVPLFGADAWDVFVKLL